MKACVATSFGSSLSETFHDWIERRGLLKEHGVETPHLIGVGEALLIEEFISYSLGDLLRASSTREVLLYKLGFTGGILAKLRFVPVSIHDWRSRGEDVVLIDFGEDLGGWGVRRMDFQDFIQRVDAFAHSWRISLSSGDFDVIRRGYETGTAT